jgi:hypothetical protein
MLLIRFNGFRTYHHPMTGFLSPKIGQNGNRIRRPQTAIPIPGHHSPSCMDNAYQRPPYRTLRGMKRLPVALQRVR